LLTGVLPTKQILANEEATFERIGDLIFCATPPNAKAEVSLSLLNELRAINNALAFFYQHKNIYVKLMRLWISFMPFFEDNYMLLRPLLPLSWTGFGDLLSIDLPLDWNERVVQELLSQSYLPSKEELDYLQTSHNFLVQFFKQLSQDARRWPTAREMFKIL